MKYKKLKRKYNSLVKKWNNHEPCHSGLQYQNANERFNANKLIESK